MLTFLFEKVPTMKSILSILFALLLFSSCQEKQAIPLQVKRIDSAIASEMAQNIRSKVAAEVDSSLELSIWAVDSLVGDPIALDIDHKGRVYITRTNRPKNSEFDIRGHVDWEIGSIKLQTPEERRAFLQLELSPDSAEVNSFLKDLNGDGINDWQDLAVEKEQVFRFIDSDGDGLADERQLFFEGLNDVITDPAGALEIVGDNVYVGAGPDMWQLNDKDGDGYAEQSKSISNGYAVHIGFGGHGMSGAELGPDGRLYWGIGDIGFNGVDQDGKRWKYPNRGVIVRSELDGSNFEVFAMGLRNTHEFVFDKYANLISEDNDGDHAGESERLVYVVEGSDTGWRINWQFGKYKDPKNNDYKVWMDERLNVPRWEGQAAYITPCIRNYVNGPTGMLYHPGGTWSSKWKDHFFIVEFVGNPSRSAIHAFTLKPQGASFAFDQGKKILGGVLPTGIDWSPEGAMYAADWIDGWETKDYGRIWKLDDPSGHDWALRKETAELVPQDFTTFENERLSILLGHADMRIRQKAQFALVERSDEGNSILQAAIAQTDNQLKRIHGIIGVAQMARTVDSKYAQFLVRYLSDEDQEIRAQTAKWLGDIRYEGSAPSIVPLLKDFSPRARFFAAEALGRMAYSEAHSEIEQMLIKNNDEDAYLRHVGSLALARIGNETALSANADHHSSSLRMASVLALRRMESPEIRAFLNDELLIVREAARAINDDWSIPDALEDLAALLNRTPYIDDEVIIRRAINANLRVGNNEALQRVLLYASNSLAPTPMREEAIETMKTWFNPSVLDRVDGRYRGEIKRDQEAVVAQIKSGVLRLLNDEERSIVSSAARLIGFNKISEGVIPLSQILQNSKIGSVRREALSALIALNPANMDEILASGLQDKNLNVRVVALEAIGNADMKDEAKLHLLNELLSTRTTREKQKALEVLATLPIQLTRGTLSGLLDEYASEALPPQLGLDLSLAIEEIGDQQLSDRLDQIRSSKAPDDTLAAYIDCLSGGESGKGSGIFWRHAEAQCVRCHEMNDYGGKAGPSLTHIADLLTPQEILESLILPSKRIAPGYGVVSLFLKDGREIDGILIEEQESSLVVRTADELLIDVKKDDIDERIDGVSSMPDMRNILTKKEIRDLVTYLSKLKSAG